MPRDSSKPTHSSHVSSLSQVEHSHSHDLFPQTSRFLPLTHPFPQTDSSPLSSFALKLRCHADVARPRRHRKSWIPVLSSFLAHASLLYLSPSRPSQQMLRARRHPPHRGHYRSSIHCTTIVAARNDPLLQSTSSSRRLTIAGTASSVSWQRAAQGSPLSKGTGAA